MSIVTKNGNQRKTIAFLLIIVLLLGGLVTPIVSMAGNEDAQTVTVTFKMSDNSSDDVKADIPTKEDGTAILKGEYIPDDPTPSDGEKFMGWQFTGDKAKGDDGENRFYSKNDLKNYELTESKTLNAVFEKDKAAEPIKSKTDALEESNGTDEPAESKTTETPAAKQKSGDMGIQSTDTVKATFVGVSLNGDSDSVTVDTYDSIYSFKTLNVKATFDDKTLAKTVKITLPEGMAFENIYGMTATNGNKDNWKDIKTYTQPYDTLIDSIDYTQGKIHASGYQSKSGTVTYNLKPGTDDITLSLDINADAAYTVHDDVLTIKDAIQIKTTKGSNTDYGSAVLEKYNISGTMHSCYYPLNGTPDEVTSIGGDYGLEFGLYGRMKGTSNQISRYVVSDMAIKLSMPKVAGMKNVALSSFQGRTSTIKESDYVQYLDTTSDPENDILTVTFSAVTNFTHPYLEVQGTITDDANIGNRFRAQMISSERTLFNSDNASKYYEYTSKYIKVVDDVQEFTFGQIGYPYISDDDRKTPEVMSMLGGFNIKNESVSSISGMRLRMDFDDPNIGVEAVKLMTGKEGAKDIVVTTNKDEYYIASATGTYTETQKSGYITLNFKEGVRGGLLTTHKLTDGEYITSVEYTMGDIPSGAYTYGYGMFSDTNNGGLDAIQFFGKLLRATSQYSATATVLRPTEEGADYSDESKWEKNQDSFTQTLDVQSVTNSIRYNMTSPANSSINAGSSKSISATFGIYEGRYSASELRAYKGFVIYLVEDENLTIDKSSIRIANQGKNIPLTADEVTGPYEVSGKNVYKITLKDALVGRYTESLGADTVKVDYDVTAKNTAKNKNVYYKDMIFGHVLGQEDKYATVYNGPSSASGNVIKDSLALTGNTENNVVTPYVERYMKVNASKALTVTTYAGSDGKTWKSYDRSNPDSVVSLNTQLDAKYKVSAYNGSGEAMPDGYTVYIPIPKEGKNSNSTYIQEDDFEWSLYLKKALDLGEGYTVKYSESYTTVPNDSSWEDIGGVSLKDVRMIKIECTKEMANDQTDEFVIDFDVPKDAEAIAAKGKTNIYSSVIYANVAGAGGAYKSSEKIALQLNTGIVSGRVMLDSDKNSVFSTDDTGMPSIQVRAYTPGGLAAGKEPLASTSTNSNGEYIFNDFSADQYVDIVFESPASAANPMKFITPTSVSGNAKLGMASNVLADGGTTSTDISALLQTPYNVTFNVNGGVGAPDPQYVYKGDTATEPATDPTRTNYRFLGWYKGSAASEFDFTGTPINEETELTAKWIEQHTIKFDADSGGYLTSGSGLSEATDASFTVSKIDHNKTWNEAIGTVPTPVSNDGYYFKGWNPELPAASDKITESTVYKAEFAKKETLTFTAIDAPSKEYNGATQNAKVDVKLTGDLVENHAYNDGDIKATASGMIADEYTLNFPNVTAADLGVDPDKGLSYYYDINYVYGKFSITKKYITVKPENESKPYDESALTPKTMTHSALAGNDTLGSKTLIGSQTEIGSSNSTVSAVTILNGLTDVTDSCYNVIKSSGTLTVTSGTSMTVAATGIETEYDSNKHGITATSNVAGATYVYSKTETGTYTADVPKFDAVGEYTVWVKAKHAKYNDSEPKSAVVKITAKPLTIRPVDAQKYFDNTPLTPTNYAIASGSVAGNDTISKGSIIYTGSIKDKGTTDSGISKLVIERDGSLADVTSNYALELTKGALTILAANDLGLTVTDNAVTYDGKPHTVKGASAFTKSGSTNATFEYSTKGATGPWSDKEPTFTEVNESGHDVWIKASKASYDEVVAEGKVYIDKREITVKPVDVEAEYDGKPHGPTKAALATGSLYDIVDGHVLTEGTLKEDKIDSGEYKTTASGFTVKKGSIDESPNYDIKYVSGSLKINRSGDMTVSALDKTLTYNAIAHSIDDGEAFGHGKKVNVVIEYSTSGAADTFKTTKPEYIYHGSYDYYVRAQAADNYITSPAVKATLDINKKDVVIKPENETKPYDGTPLKATRITSSGLVASDEISDINYEGSQTEVGSSDSTVSAFKIRSGGLSGTDVTESYKVKKEAGDLTVSLGNDLIISKVTGTSVVYDAEGHGVKALANKSGATILYSATENGTYTDIPITYDEASKDEYTIWVKASHPKYITSPAVSAKVEIKHRPLTVKPENETKYYDGKELTASRVAIENGTVANNDAIDMDKVEFTGSIIKAGNTDSAIKTFVIERKSSNDDVTKNYDISYNGGKLIILNATDLGLIVTGDSVTYDGGAHGIKEASAFTKEGTTDVAFSYSTKGATGPWSNTAPTFTEVNETGYRIWVKASKESYDDSTPVEGKVYINKRGITVRPVDVKVEYDGNSHGPTKAAVTDDQYGLVSGHTLTPGTLKDDKTEAGNYITTASGFKIMNGASDKSLNYDIKYVNGNLIINKSDDMTVLITDKSLTYDSIAQSIDDGEVSGHGKKVNAVIEYSTSAGAGTYKALKPEYIDHGTYDYYVRAQATDNYVTSEAVKATLKINKRSVTLIPEDESKIYDGKALMASKTIVAGGSIAAADTLENVKFVGSITDVGTTKSSIAGYDITRDGKSAKDNYIVTTEQGNLTITVSSGLAISANGLTKLYNDTAQDLIDVGFTITGGKSTDVPIFQYSQTSGTDGFKADEPEFTDAGTYKVWVRAFHHNYTTTDAIALEVKVSQRTLDITVAGDSKIYDGKALTPSKHTMTGDGLVSGHNLDATYSGSITDKGTVDGDIGAYSIKKGSDVKTPNYVVNVTKGKLEITARDLTIKPEDASKVYDGKVLSTDKYSVDGSGLVSGDTLTVDIDGSITNMGTEDATVKKYTVNRSGNDIAGNYNVTTKKGTLTVNARPVIIIPLDASKVFDGAPLTATDVIVHTSSKYDMVAGDKLTDPVFDTEITDAGSAPVKVKSVKVNGETNNNYEFESLAGTLTITENPDVLGETSDPSNPSGSESNFTPKDDGSVLGEGAQPDTSDKGLKNALGLTIGDTTIPLFGNGFDSWALVNLMLTVAGILLALGMIFTTVYRRMRDNKEGYTYEESYTYDRDNEDPDYIEKRRNRKLFIIAAAICAIAGLVLFIITQDVSLPIVLLDFWTIFNLIIFVVEVICVSMAFRKKKEEYEEYEEETI